MSLLLTAGVVATWLAITVLVFGIGGAFLRAFVRVELSWTNALLSVLCGFALLVGALLLWHFVFPVNGVALAVFIIGGSFALFAQRDWLVELSRRRPSLAHALPIGVFAMWAANHALGDAGWDDHNYELQAVRWFHDFAIVPGLANLHGRFGFNNSHHLYAALLSAWPWAGAVNHLVNGLFVVLAFALSWDGCLDLLRRRISAQAVFAAAILGPSVGAAVIGAEFGLAMISTLKVDVAVSALTFIAAMLWIRLADRTAPDTQRGAVALTVALLCGLLFSLKLSSAVFVAVLFAAVLVRVATMGEMRRLLLPMVLVVAVTGGAVLARGVVLSGYPLYPSTVMGADVDWRVPRAQADVERRFINTWGRLRATFDMAQPVEGWFTRWMLFTILTNRVTLVVPFAVVAALVPLLMLGRRRPVRGMPSRVDSLVLCLGSIGALVVWFIEAPDSRFAWSYCWILAALAITHAVGRGVHRPHLILPFIVTACIGAVMFWRFDFSLTQGAAVTWTLLFVAAWLALALRAHDGRRPGLGVLCLVVGIYPLADRLMTHVIYRRPAEIASLFWLRVNGLAAPLNDATPARQTFSGLTVYETRSSDYFSPLPSTPYINRYLELRHPPDMKLGFRNASQLPYPRFGYRPRVGGSSPDE